MIVKGPVPGSTSGDNSTNLGALPVGTGEGWGALDATGNPAGYVLVTAPTSPGGLQWVSPGSASLPSGTANEVLATPSGTSGATSLRALVAADIPGLPASTITSGQLVVAQGGTGLGTLGTAGQVLTVNSGATALTYATPSAGGGTPGGTTGQIQYDAAGSFGGFTMSGDATLVASTGVITVAKTGGAAFAPSATTDTTIASNIASGTLAAARLPLVPVASGGTNLTTLGTASQIIGVNTGATALEYKTLTQGANITITPSAGAITIAASASAGMTNPMTTAGDTIYGGTAGAPTRLPVGSNGAVMLVNSLVPAWYPMSGDVGIGETGGTTIQAGVINTGKINTGAVTYAKMQATNAPSVLLGNPTGITESLSEITLAGGLAFSGTTLTGAALAPLASPTFTGSVTLPAGTVTLGEHANLAPSSLMGNPTSSAAAPSAITLGTNLSFTSGVLNAAGGTGLTNPMTTVGDTIYGGTAGAPTRLPVGATGSLLSVVAGDPAWKTTGLVITQHTGVIQAPTPTSGSSTWSYIQASTPFATTGSPSSVATTFAGAVTAGDLIVVAVGFQADGNGQTFSAQDNINSTPYTFAGLNVTPTVQYTYGYIATFYFTTPLSASAGTFTVTITSNDNMNGPIIGADEFRDTTAFGIDAALTGIIVGGGSSISLGSNVGVTGNDLVYAVTYSSGGSAVITAGTGFTAGFSQSATGGGLASEFVLNQTSPIDPGSTTTGNMLGIAALSLKSTGSVTGLTIDWSTGDWFMPASWSGTTALPLTFSNLPTAPSSQAINLILTQGSGGQLVTGPSGVTTTWVTTTTGQTAGSTPTLSTGAGLRDQFLYKSLTSTTCLGYVIGQGF